MEIRPTLTNRILCSENTAKEAVDWVKRQPTEREAVASFAPNRRLISEIYRILKTKQQEIKKNQ